VNFGLFKKELLLLPPFIRKSVAKLIFRFVPHSFTIFYLFKKRENAILIERVSEGSLIMTGGEIAGLIAAIAFAVLVVFIVKVLLQLSKTLEKVDQTVAEANTTIEVVTKDVDVLSRQVEGLLVKSNELLLDINGKVATIDPLFTAVADLSESVSELNVSSKNIVTKVGGIGKTTAKATVAGKVGGTALKFFKNKKHTETTGGK